MYKLDAVSNYLSNISVNKVRTRFLISVLYSVENERFAYLQVLEIGHLRHVVVVVARIVESVGAQHLGGFLVDSVQPGREAESTEADAHTIGLSNAAHDDLSVTVLILLGNLDPGQERVCRFFRWNFFVEADNVFIVVTHSRLYECLKCRVLFYLFNG